MRATARNYIRSVGTVSLHCVIVQFRNVASKTERELKLPCVVARPCTILRLFRIRLFHFPPARNRHFSWQGV